MLLRVPQCLWQVKAALEAHTQAGNKGEFVSELSKQTVRESLPAEQNVIVALDWGKYSTLGGGQTEAPSKQKIGAPERSAHPTLLFAALGLKRASKTQSGLNVEAKWQAKQYLLLAAGKAPPSDR